MSTLQQQNFNVIWLLLKRNNLREYWEVNMKIVQTWASPLQCRRGLCSCTCRSWPPFRVVGFYSTGNWSEAHPRPSPWSAVAFGQSIQYFYCTWRQFAIGTPAASTSLRSWRRRPWGQRDGTRLPSTSESARRLRTFCFIIKCVNSKILVIEAWKNGLTTYELGISRYCWLRESTFLPLLSDRFVLHGGGPVCRNAAVSCWFAFP